MFLTVQFMEKGKSKGRRHHPNFWKSVPKNYFKALVRITLCLFAEKKWWFIGKKDKLWDLILLRAQD